MHRLEAEFVAKSTITHVTDDIDGSPNAEIVTFALQGVGYTIDLGQKNLEKLTKALSPFIDKATRQRGNVSSSVRKSNGHSERGYDIPALREWAAKKKISLPKRGRIPGAIVQQYLAANSK